MEKLTPALHWSDRGSIRVRCLQIHGYSRNFGEYYAIGTFSEFIEVTQGDEFKARALSTRLDGSSTSTWELPREL